MVKTILLLYSFIRKAYMNPYQLKWLEVLQHANLQGWTLKAVGNDIYIEMPSITDLKLIRDSIPSTLAAISLDITVPKSRIRFIFHNGHETFDYILNPDNSDLNGQTT